ncbi:hypothetical protein SDC9_18343 [bioreactor metagenome]|uniref:Archaeal Type IV pilin N-terminal domain-containing protein n=1 Tax=bioreactor metagenome TaxID=1076179 RepID=A0A644U007_9ZZZZ
MPGQISLLLTLYYNKMNIMKVTAKKNDGVSPVIGTILLVTITVVLVAIISAVVMGMTGGIGTSHVVGVKVGQDSAVTGGMLVTITGGADVNQLSKYYVYNGSIYVGNTTNTTVGVPQAFVPGVGQASISIVGQFPDGNQTIYTGTIYL